MCCTENTGHKKSPKIRHLRTIAQMCRAVSSRLRHVSTIGMKLNKQQYPLSSICPHNMVNFGPLAPEIGLLACVTPANFNGFRVLASLVHRPRLTHVNQTLHDVWPSLVLVYYIYTFGGVCTLSEFCRSSLALSYIGGVTARRSSSGRELNFAAWDKEWN